MTYIMVDDVRGDAEALLQIKEEYTSISYGSPSPLRHFLAYIDGQPVGTGSAFIEDGVVGLASVGVIPEYRRRGIGSALTVAALKEARCGRPEYLLTGKWLLYPVPNWP